MILQKYYIYEILLKNIEKALEKTYNKNANACKVHAKIYVFHKYQIDEREGKESG